MILKTVILKNFRGYSGEHRIDVSSEITALIGKNDAGKSTLLEALDIFYGESKPELSDLNIYAKEREMAFGAVFTDLPKTVSVDTSATTSLPDEYLVNKDGDFEAASRSQVLLYVTRLRNKICSCSVAKADLVVSVGMVSSRKVWGLFVLPTPHLRSTQPIAGRVFCMAFTIK